MPHSSALRKKSLKLKKIHDFAKNVTLSDLLAAGFSTGGLLGWGSWRAKRPTAHSGAPDPIILEIGNKNVISNVMAQNLAHHIPIVVFQVYITLKKNPNSAHGSHFGLLLVFE